MSARTKYLLLAIATLATSGLAISNQSLWIDEGGAAWKTMQPSVGAWWEALRAEGNSNLQLLPHLFFLWVWDKIFGHSEVTLRAANIPLLFGGLAAAIWGLKARVREQFWFCAVTLLNAFTWYYLSEARPYILLFAASCLVLACLVRIVDTGGACVRDHFWFALFTGGLVLLSATSLIAVPWALAWFLSAIILSGLREFSGSVRKNVGISITFAAATLALGGYYLWTIRVGARASEMGTTDHTNFLFALYEQAGLSGFGPGRNELRMEGLRSLRPFAIPLIGGATLVLFVAAHGLRTIRGGARRSKATLALGSAILFPILLVLLAGRLTHVRIVGRHLVPLYPIVLYVISAGTEELWRQRSAARAGAAVIGIFVLLLSALEVRFAPRHARDDYRGAASIARASLAQGEIVWWAADVSTGAYYQVPLRRTAEPGSAVVVMNPSLADVTQLPTPDIILLSKHDVYDNPGTIADYANRHGFRESDELQAFHVLRTPRTTR